MTGFATFEDRAVWLIEKLLADFPQWKLDDAAADAGNAGGESEIQMIQEGGQVAPNGGWGIYQWTGPRRTEFTAYCARSGRDPNSLETGYAFHFVELKGAFAKVIDEVAAAPDLPAKVLAFEQHYEMAGIPRIGNREDYANRAKAAYLAAHPAPVQPVPVPPPPQPVPLPVPPNPSAPDDPGVPTKGHDMTVNLSSMLKVVIGILQFATGAGAFLVPPAFAPVLVAVLGLLTGAHAMTSAVATDPNPKLKGQ